MVIVAEGLEHAAESISLFVIGTGLLQNAIYLVQLALAAATLIQAPPTASGELLWRRYSEAAPPIGESRAVRPRLTPGSRTQSSSARARQAGTGRQQRGPQRRIGDQPAHLAHV